MTTTSKAKLTKAQSIALNAQAMGLPTPSLEFDAKLTKAAREGASFKQGGTRK